MSKRSLKTETAFIVAAIALVLQFASPGAMAADLLAQARQLSLPARAYQELTPINDQFEILITRMESNTEQLKTYRKARIRATDKRYSALTREFNQSRSMVSQLERKLDKARSLDVNRFTATADGDLAMAAEEKKYEQAKASLRRCLKILSDHYDQQLREIASLH